MSHLLVMFIFKVVVRTTATKMYYFTASTHWVAPAYIVDYHWLVGMLSL